MLVKSGFKVGITGRRATLLEELKAENPDLYVAKTFDITDSKNIERNLDEITNDIGGLDILIISAAIRYQNEVLDNKM